MNEVVNKINYTEIKQVVENQLIEVMNQDQVFYKGYTLKITNELQFVKKAFKDNPKCICIVLKFGSATVNYFQSVLPATIMALSEENHVYVARKLLTEYVEYFNLVRPQGHQEIFQIYSTPDVSNNFENETTGFKSIITSSATFVVSKDANFFNLFSLYSNIKAKSSSNVDVEVTNLFKFAKNVGYSYTSKEEKEYIVSKATNGAYTVTWNDDGTSRTYNFPSTDPIKVKDEFGVNLTQENQVGVISATIVLNIETIPTLSQHFGANLDLDSQIMYKKRNFSDSIGKYGTRTISIGTYFMHSTRLFNDVLDICISDDDNDTENENVASGINHTFALYLEFASGRKYKGAFKLAKFDADQKIGEIPGSSYVFTN